MHRGGTSRAPRRPRPPLVATVSLAFGATAFALLVTVAPAYAQSGDPSKTGELTGNLPFGVYLLIPLALALALLTAVVLGPRGEPDPAGRRFGGVSRALSRRENVAGRST